MSTGNGTESRSGEPDILLNVRGLKMHFPITKGIIFQRQVGAIKAVDGIDFELYRGGTLGLVGELGCGKADDLRLEAPQRRRRVLREAVGVDASRTEGGS